MKLYIVCQIRTEPVKHATQVKSNILVITSYYCSKITLAIHLVTTEVIILLILWITWLRCSGKRSRRAHHLYTLSVVKQQIFPYDFLSQECILCHSVVLSCTFWLEKILDFSSQYYFHLFASINVIKMNQWKCSFQTKIQDSSSKCDSHVWLHFEAT
jgi:hypothetical protein